VYTSVTFGTECEGDRRVQRVIVGHQFNGKTVLGIDAGSSGDVAIVLVGGEVQMVAAGSVLSTEVGPKPARIANAEPKRVRPVLPTVPPRAGMVRAVRFHSGYREIEIAVGDRFDSRWLVERIVQGDPVTATLHDGSSRVLCGAGSVVRWTMG
jgi:hypothetical protein